MTYGHLMPELEAHHRVERQPRKRQKVRIPSMGNTIPPSHYSDETVIRAVYMTMEGVAVRQVAELTGIDRQTIYQWASGINRSKCYREALKRHHRAHGGKRYG